MTNNTFCEHIVKQKCQGKYLIYRILLIGLYLALLIIPSFAIIMFAPANLIIPFLLVIATVVFIIFRLTWNLTSIEYEYQIIEDSVTFSKIFGRRRRKTVLEMPIRAFSVLGAHTPESEHYLKNLMVDRTYLFISSPNAENIYFGVFDAEGETCIIYFEATESAVARLSRHGSFAMRAYEREIRAAISKNS